MSILVIRKLAIFVLICSCHFSWSYASSHRKPYCSRSFFMHSSQDSLGWPFFRFPVISSSITSRIWELMSWQMTWPHHYRWLWIITSSIFTTIPTLSHRTSVNTLSTSLTPHILIIQCCNPCNLASFSTVGRVQQLP